MPNVTATRPLDERRSRSFRQRVWVTAVLVLVFVLMAFRLARTLPRAALSQVERLTHTTLACASFKVRANG